MKESTIFLPLLCLSIFLIPCVPLYDPGRVIGGRNAVLRDAPYIVSLQITYQKKGHVCGGSLISPIHILTAAHCFNGINEYVMKYLMNVVHDVDSSFGKGTDHRQTKLIEAAHIHEKYNNTDYDIAMVQVKKAFKINSVTSTISISSKSFPYGTECLIFGWGRRIADIDKSSKILQMAVIVIDIELTCTFRNHLTEICAGNLGGGLDACVGDSGGPLVCDGTLTGLVSRGVVPCAQPLIGTIFTNVTSYKDWIRKAKTELERKKTSNIRNVVSFIKDHAHVPFSNSLFLTVKLLLASNFFLN